MSRGADRERKVARILRADGWAAWTTKNDGLEHEDKRFSHGIVDVVAIRVAEPDATLTKVGLISRGPWSHPLIRLIQVKSTRTPYHHFSPEERGALLAEAVIAGASAELWHWPKHAREPTVIPSAAWPAFREEAA